MGSTTKKWYINLNEVQVSTSPEGDPTQVTGPTVRWASPTGITGVIPNGSYG